MNTKLYHQTSTLPTHDSTLLTDIYWYLTLCTEPRRSPSDHLIPFPSPIYLPRSQKPPNTMKSCDNVARHPPPSPIAAAVKNAGISIDQPVCRRKPPIPLHLYSLTRFSPISAARAGIDRPCINHPTPCVRCYFYLALMNLQRIEEATSKSIERL
jgi:hypothetical protein